MEENKHDEVVVIGGGISGLSAAYRIHERTGQRVTVLEASEGAGGKVQTDHVGGFTIDRGPNGFTSRASNLWTLAFDLGVSKEIRSASRHASARFIYADAELHRLSANPLSLLRSELLSRSGVWRAMCEPLIPAGDGQEETVWDFFERRFGAEFANRIAATAVIGISASDARQLSMNAMFPEMIELEQKYSSVVRGLIARQLKSFTGGVRKQLVDERGSQATQKGLMNFGAAGMHRLIAALEEHPGLDIQTNTAVERVRHLSERHYQIDLRSGASIEASQVIITTSSHAAASMVRTGMRDLADQLSSIRYNDMAVVTLGFEDEGLREVPEGYGFLVQRGEGIRMLGSQWTSSIFPEQTLRRHTVVRCLYGGSFDNDIMSLDRGTLFRITRSELRRTMGVSTSPILRHTTRYPLALPQYEFGHRRRVRKIHRTVGEYPGLHIGGNAHYGISLESCVEDAYRITTEVVMDRRGSAVTVPERV